MKAYINNKIDNHFDNTHRLTTAQFMSFAKDKYEEMQTDHSWMKSKDVEEQLVALTAQMEVMEKKNQQLHLKLKRQIDAAQASRTTKIAQSKKKKKQQDKWTWKEKPPRKNDKQQKDFEGKTYHWCPIHKRWTLHTPSECRLKDKKENQEKTSTDRENDAFAVIYEEEEEDGAFSSL